MSKTTFLLPRFPILSEDELNKTIQEMLKKISHMFIAPDDPALHPLAVNREIFDKHHDKIKGALEIVDGENPVTAENQAIFDLLDVIGELCGKELTSPYKP
jgi:hypothetical protein